MLKRISVQNFKSLKDVTLDLQPVNLLIGPNNSGKSNLLKALEYWREDAFQVTGIINNVESTDENEKIALLKEQAKSSRFVRKYMSVVYQKEYGLRITNTLTYSHGIIKKCESSPNKQSVEMYTESDIPQKKKAIIPPSSNFFIYQPNPNLFTKPYPLLPNSETVAPDCANLVSFLDTLRDKDPEAFDAIQNDLKICIPEYAGIRFENVTPDEDLKSRFGDKTFKKLGLFHIAHKLTYWAEELSEGTLYFLALLCIVHQPNPPQVLLLEEPERGIHPRRIREVMDFIFRLAEEKKVQVIMTTHSPEVLNEFEDFPASVFIFDKDDEGATQVKNLWKDIIEPSNISNKDRGIPEMRFTDGLGESWLTGFLGGVPK